MDNSLNELVLAIEQMLNINDSELNDEQNETGKYKKGSEVKAIRETADYWIKRNYTYCAEVAGVDPTELMQNLRRVSESPGDVDAVQYLVDELRKLKAAESVAVMIPKKSEALPKGKMKVALPWFVSNWNRKYKVPERTIRSWFKSTEKESGKREKTISLSEMEVGYKRLCKYLSPK